MDNRYSEIKGLGKPENEQDEIAIRSFFLYLKKYKLNAFNLPKWFISARKKFTQEEFEQMEKDERYL